MNRNLKKSDFFGGQRKKKSWYLKTRSAFSYSFTCRLLEETIFKVAHHTIKCLIAFAPYL